ncbi:TPA: hypothetical protein DCX16_00380, partial [bacterium]|nr:hypothetical protein [bacterium]
AVLDTGVDYDHPDLKDKVIKGYDYVNNDDCPMDDHDYSDKHSHGTHVAGIIGASTDNNIGVAGLAWNCKLLAVKCFDQGGYGNDAKISLAIRYAADYPGVKVINMSFGDRTPPAETLKRACDYAYEKGIFLVAACGNDGNDTKFYPAAYDNVMAVAATNQDDYKAWLSNYGYWVDIAAPGDDIYSTLRTDKGSYGYGYGTSMACPFVAGLAGLIFSKNPSLTNAQVAKIIKENASDIGNQNIGKRINAYNALVASLKKWTFMVYLDGDNDLENAAINDFLEMASVGSTHDVSIVVQFDRIPYYDSSYGNWTGTKRFYITKNMTPCPENAVMDIDEVNMGDPNTLRDFIIWAKHYYPAENYALILWDHGSGWKTKTLEKRKPKCICYDSTSNYDSLTLSELRTALSNVGKIDLIGFDACLMAMVEVAYEIKDYADIMVASEEDEPCDGWDYKGILNSLVGSPTMSSEYLGKRIVETYIKSSEPSQVVPSITLSCIDLSKMGSLALSLKSITSLPLDMINDARNKVLSLNGDPSYIDLYDFARCLNIGIEPSVIFESHKPPGSYTGLSIYFPKSYDYYLGSYTAQNLLFAKDTGWDELILRFFYLPSSLTISCPETTTTHNTFTLTIYTKDSQGASMFSALPITISNLTNSIIPSMYTLTGSETKIVTTITKSPNYGLDIITVRLSDLIATKSINVFINPSEKSLVSTDNVELFIPSDTFSVPVTININTVSTTSVPEWIKPAISYEIIALDTSSQTITGLNGTITITFSYDEKDGVVAKCIKEKDLCVFQDGDIIPSFINFVSNTITATVTEKLSLFTIGGTQTYAEVLVKPTVFPNPFIWNKHKFIIFGDPNVVEKRLPAYGDIRIYNIAGELIDELKIRPEDDGKKIWYPKKGLSSGVYIFTINKKAFGKIGVIR